MNIPGYSFGGPVIIPKVLDRGKMFFFVSQEFTDDLRPATFSRTNYPDGARAAGGLLADLLRQRERPGPGHAAADHQPGHGPAVPGEQDSSQLRGHRGLRQRPHDPLGQQMLNLLPMPNGYFDPANNQYNAYNYGVDTYPYHSRTNNTLRLDVVLNASLRGSYRFIKDREDNISNNVFAPGIGWANNAVPGYISTGSITKVLGPNLVNETTVGFAHNSYAWYADDGDNYEDYRQYYRSAAGVEPPRLEPFGAYRDPQGLGYDQSDEYPYLPAMTYGGGQTRANLASYNPGRAANRILPAANRNDRWTFTNDLSWTRGRHNFKFGFLTEWASKTEPLSPDYARHVRLRAQRAESAQHRQRLRERAPRCVHDLHRADQPRRPRPAALADGRLRAGQLAREVRTSRSTTACGSRTRARTSTRGSPRPASTSRLVVGPGAAPLLADVHDGCAREPDLRGQQPARIRPGQPGGAAAERVHRQHRAGLGLADQRHDRRRLPRHAAGRVLRASRRSSRRRVSGLPGTSTGTASRRCVRPRARSTRYPHAVRGKGYVGTAPAAFNRQVRWATFADIENFATSGKTFVETPINSQYAGGETRSLEKSYNLNVTYQRDIGFSTTAEVAYVGSWTYTGGRTDDINRPVNNVYLLADPSRMFNGNALDTNLLRTELPGDGQHQRSGGTRRTATRSTTTPSATTRCR